MNDSTNDLTSEPAVTPAAAAAPVLVLPVEHRFDVPAAARSIAAIVDKDPATPITLSLALVDEDGNMNEESEVPMLAIAVCALLEKMQEDQRIPGVSVPLYLLRVSQSLDKYPGEYSKGNEGY